MGTYTTNYQLYMPTVGEQGWGDLVNGNFIAIDTTMKGLDTRIGTLETETDAKFTEIDSRLSEHDILLQMPDISEITADNVNTYVTSKGVLTTVVNLIAGVLHGASFNRSKSLVFKNTGINKLVFFITHTQGAVGNCSATIKVNSNVMYSANLTVIETVTDFFVLEDLQDGDIISISTSGKCTNSGGTWQYGIKIDMLPL